ncbi:hypothetical protein ACWDR0_20490 [Streptomyces sp. NPDC003691]
MRPGNGWEAGTDPEREGEREGGREREQGYGYGPGPGEPPGEGVRPGPEPYGTHRPADDWFAAPADQPGTAPGAGSGTPVAPASAFGDGAPAPGGTPQGASGNSTPGSGGTPPLGPRRARRAANPAPAPGDGDDFFAPRQRTDAPGGGNGAFAPGRTPDAGYGNSAPAPGGSPDGTPPLGPRRARRAANSLAGQAQGGTGDGPAPGGPGRGDALSEPGHGPGTPPGGAPLPGDGRGARRARRAAAPVPPPGTAPAPAPPPFPPAAPAAPATPAAPAAATGTVSRAVPAAGTWSGPGAGALSGESPYVRFGPVAAGLVALIATFLPEGNLFRWLPVVLFLMAGPGIAVLRVCAPRLRRDSAVGPEDTWEDDFGRDSDRLELLMLAVFLSTALTVLGATGLIALKFFSGTGLLLLLTATTAVAAACPRLPEGRHRYETPATPPQEG